MLNPTDHDCDWYSQSNLNAATHNAIETACHRLGKPFTSFRIIPFQTEMPRLRAEWPFVLIGSTTLTTNAIKSKKYRRGIFFDPKTFKPEVYAQKYGTDYLNSDVLVTPINKLTDDLFRLDEEIFIRSNDDSKQISGGTCEYQDLLKIRDNTQTHYLNGTSLHPKQKFLLALEKR